MKYYHPSSLRAGELCPRFTRMEQKDSSAAERGTRIHKAIETGDYSKLESDEERDTARKCLEYRDSLPKGLAARHEVSLRADILEGTIDYVDIMKNGTVLVLDWKTGRTPVLTADKNLQIQAYVKLLMDTDPKIDSVNAHVVSPLCASSQSHATYYRKTDEAGMSLNDINLRIGAVIARMEDETCEATPSEEACEWCGGKAHCPKLTTLAIRQGSMLPDPVSFEAGRIMSPENRAKAHVLAAVLEDWAKQIKHANTQAVIQDGVEIPGFRLRSRIGNTQIVDMKTAVDLIKAEGLTESSILNACSMSLSKLSDIYYTEKGGTKKDARETIETKLKSTLARGEPVIWLQREKSKQE